MNNDTIENFRKLEANDTVTLKSFSVKTETQQTIWTIVQMVCEISSGNRSEDRF